MDGWTDVVVGVLERLAMAVSCRDAELCSDFPLSSVSKHVGPAAVGYFVIGAKIAGDSPEVQAGVWVWP